MTHIELEEIHDMMKRLFGDKIANPEVFPMQFAYQIKMAKFELSIQPKTEIQQKEDEV